MFQFNFRAGIIRLAIKPVLKIFLLTRSWENSYKSASANLRSLGFVLCSPQSNVQVCRHPAPSDVNSLTRMILSPSNSSVIISYLHCSAWKGFRGAGIWVTQSLTMPPGHSSPATLPFPESPCNAKEFCSSAAISDIPWVYLESNPLNSAGSCRSKRL